MKEIETSRSPWEIALKNREDKNIYVNLSFDLELALNGSFWRGDLKSSLAYSELALANIADILPRLNASHIQYNVQICGGLLEPDFSSLPFLSAEQGECLRSNRKMFLLDESLLNDLKRTNVDAGIHSFSHRDFQKLSRQEIIWEIEKSIETYRKYFLAPPGFMAFPNNSPDNENVISDFSLCYRANNNGVPPTKRSIPKGLYWHPLSLSPEELKKLIAAMSGQRPLFLHLWQHFTETNAEQMQEYLNVLRMFDCRLVNMKSFLSLLSD